MFATTILCMHRKGTNCIFIKNDYMKNRGRKEALLKLWIISSAEKTNILQIFFVRCIINTIPVTTYCLERMHLFLLAYIVTFLLLFEFVKMYNLNQSKSLLKPITPITYWSAFYIEIQWILVDPSKTLRKCNLL